MRIKVDQRKLQTLVQIAPQQFQNWLASAAEDIANDVKLIFNTGKPGASYRRGSVVHIASAPGEPPMVDTGALRASIHVEQQSRLNYRITDGVEYGAYLEVGTSNIKPRPFMTPVIESWRQGKLAKHAQAAFGDILERS